MNILFLLRLWPVYGGGETVTISLSNELVKRSWNVSVAYFKDSKSSITPYIDNRIKKIRIENINCDEFNVDLTASDNVSRNVNSIVEKENINIIINQWWPVEYLKGIKRENVKIISCLHQAFYTPNLDGRGLTAILKRFFKPLYISLKKKKSVDFVKSYLPYVDKYVFLSPSFQHQYEAFSGSNNSDKLASIPNPLVFQNSISEYDFNNKKNVVLIVARLLESQKRLSRALKIWSYIEKDENLNDWILKVVGDGPDLGNYKEMANELNLKRIYFEGYQDPLPYYLKSKIFIMTSAFEGFGMTLVESLQLGVVPVVMDSFLALHDIIIDNHNGIIIPDNDIMTFVAELKRLMYNDVKRSSLAKNAIDSADKFSVKNVVSDWEALINTLYE